MLKLLVMLVSLMLIALALLGLRQHRLEVTSQGVTVYDQIMDRRQTLLDQRVDIAKKTNPWALAATLQDAGVSTGNALRQRNTHTGGPALPAVETDLVAPLLGDGHANSSRRRP